MRMAWIAVTLLPVVGIAAQPVLSSEDESFLRDQAIRVARSARLEPGESSGKWRNSTRFTVRVPGGNMGYPAFWVRDAVMMLGGDLIPAGELEGWIRLIASTIRSGGDWQVRPGVVVPAFAVADHINFNGKATFYPGNYETGDRQGGGAWGKYPPLDDDFYFLLAVHDHWRLTGKTDLLLSTVSTASGEMRLADLCEKVYERAPVDSSTGLVMAGDVATENAKDFGFCDAIYKSGKLLFPSVLKYLSAKRLAEFCQAAGLNRTARRFRDDQQRIGRSVTSTFYRPSGKDQGWLHSATGVGNQPDVWGSAFAVWAGAVSPATANMVSRALVRAYREQTAVQQGCVRHVLTNDRVNHGHWEKADAKPGEYQNGGYWGTASGWYIAAMATVDTSAAASMARDYVRFLRNDLRADGMALAWEWFNPETGKRNNPLYVATVALPYLSLSEAGLLSRKAVAAD